MPRKPVYTIPINKIIFKELIKRKGYNIRSLTDKLSICSERTLRRALNNGLIRPIYLNNIAWGSSIKLKGFILAVVNYGHCHLPFKVSLKDILY